jgi:hypothetical protein
MGQLLFKDDIKRADWYFKDAYYGAMGSTQGSWHYIWPNAEFPSQAAIHADEMLDNKIFIRKWVERRDVGTVIHEYIRKSYRVFYSTDQKKRDWEHTSEISNCWNVFYFEDSETALAFTLRFSDLVRPMTEDHPTRHYGERYHR